MPDSEVFRQICEFGLHIITLAYLSVFAEWAHTVLIGVALVAWVTELLVQSKKLQFLDIRNRSEANFGLVSGCIIVPMVLLTFVTPGSNYYLLLALCMDAVVLLTILTLIAINRFCQQKELNFIFAIIVANVVLSCVIEWTDVIVVDFYHYYNTKEIYLCVNLFLIVGTFLLVGCSPSFTYGEAMLVSQSIILFGLDTYRHFTGQLSNLSDLYTVLQGVFMACTGLLLGIPLTAAVREQGFVLLLRWLNVFASPCLCYIWIRENLVREPFHWLVDFIYTDITRRNLVYLWLALVALACLIVILHHHRDEHSSQHSCGLTRVRKMFHFIIIAIFLPGLVYDPELLYVAACGALLLFSLLEYTRVCKLHPLAPVLHHFLSPFTDCQDAGPIILSPTYLLLGCSLPLWLYPFSYYGGRNLVLYSGLISVGVGDAAASLVGSVAGEIRWPNCKKTLEGTCAAIFFQISFIWILYNHFGVNILPVDHSIEKLFVSVLIISYIEGFTKQVDNIILPLITYCIFMGVS